mgnify:CR=1 FL=1
MGNNSKVSEVKNRAAGTVAMLVTALLYLVWSPRYQGKTYVQGDAPGATEPDATV